jgi:hypothetical protein
MALKRWQDSVNEFLGIWLFASPWILGFAAGGGIAARTAWLLGAAIIVFAGLAVYMPKAWEEALNVLLGICLIASPWALGYSEYAGPTTNAVIVGLLVTAFGVWAMLQDTAVQRWLQDHHVTLRR